MKAFKLHVANKTEQQTEYLLTSNQKSENKWCMINEPNYQRPHQLNDLQKTFDPSHLKMVGTTN